MMLKFILLSGFFLINSILLGTISDQGWLSIASIVGSFFTFLGVCFVAWNQRHISAKQDVMATKVDGLLEQKTLADKAIGRVEAIDTAAKEKAIGDARELKSMKEQQLLNTPPPGNQQNTTTSDINVKDAQDKIISTIENEVHKQGDKIQDAVKEKGDEIKTEVPIVTADEVLKKLPPPKK